MSSPFHGSARSQRLTLFHSGFPNFPIPGTDMTFKFVDGRQDFNRAEIACLLNQGEAVVAARPAGEVIPSAGSWHRGKGPFPYAAKLEDVSFLLSNEGSNPVFTKEIGIVAIKGLREWLKTIRPRSLRFGGALIVGQGSSRPVGVLSFDSTYQGAEFTLTRLEK